MAEPLPTLIKLAESKVEAAQLKMAETRREIEGINEKIVKLHAEQERGGQMAAQSNDMVMLLQSGRFTGRMVAEVERLKMERAKLEQRLEGERKVLAAYHAEQKRYELLWKKELLKRKKRREAKQQEALDEAAGVAEWLRREEKD